MKLLRILPLALIAFSLCACTEQKSITASTTDNPHAHHLDTQATADDLTEDTFPQEDTVLYLDSSIYTELKEETNNYQLYSDSQLHGYYYKIFDNNGELLEDGFLSWQFLGFEMIHENLLISRTNSGGVLASVKLYDCQNRRITGVFPGYLGMSGDLIAYFSSDDQGIKLIVQNMFDTRLFYSEYKDNSFTPAIFSVTTCKAEFDSENENVTITYPNESGEEQSIIFSLKQ